MVHDLRFALRQMRRNPAFSLVAIVTLALAIGANTAIFSAIDALILHPLPYSNPEQLVSLTETLKKFNLINIPVSSLEFYDLRDRSQSFSYVGAAVSAAFTLTGQGAAETLSGMRISAGIFPMLGAIPVAGGLFTSDAEQFGKHRVVVLSESFWKRRFGGDPRIVGQSIELNRERYTVAGVIPAILGHMGTSDLWAPLAFPPAELVPNARNQKQIAVLARLKPGVSPARAQADLTALAAKLSAEYPKAYPADFGFSLDLLPLAGRVAGDLRTPLLVLIAAVGALMLIACANVSSLMLARAVARRKEITVRAALGAGSARLMRQLLSESVALAFVAAVIGLSIAGGVLRIYEAYGPRDLIRVQGLAINRWVAAFTIAISAAASILFGLAPALESARVDLNDALKDTARGTSGGRRRLRQVLVSVEVAASLVLLTGAGLLVRSFARIEQTDPGFQAANVLTFHLVLPTAQYRDQAKRVALFDSVISRVRALPGVVVAGAIDTLPLSGNNGGRNLDIIGRKENPGEPQPIVGVRHVTPGYFEAMGIPLRRGRFITGADGKDAPLVAVIDETIAHRYFPKEDPIGHQVSGPGDKPATIVGVVGAVKHIDLAAPPQIALYHATAQEPGYAMTFTVKTAADPLALLSAVRPEVAAVDPYLPVSRTVTMEQRLSDSLARRRIAVELMIVFAALAALVAAIGIYGVLSYLVDQRRRELAIRIALGAQAGQVVRLVTAQGAWPVAAGILAGLGGAFAATRLMQTLLFEVSPTDPMVFGGVVALLTLVAVTAVAIPARRATRVDPLVALREE
jgi:putative ABC transport system permease protein